MDILITKNLTLRPPLEVDADAIAAALQNTNISRNLTAVPQPYSITDALSWIEKWQGATNQSCFTIYRQRLMGVVSIEMRDDVADLGYWLDEPYWNKGYMTEAARAVLSHGFRKFGFDHVASGAYEDNPASLRVLEKLGFEADGERPHYNLTRQCEVTCHRMKLTRDRFENLFGPLETDVAA